MPAVDPCAEALDEARKEADLVQGVTPKNRRPRVATGIRAKDGQKARGHSGGGNNGEVEDKARRHWEYLPDENPAKKNDCKCGELNAISNAQAQGMDLRGAVIITVNVEGPNSPKTSHGEPKEACDVCKEVIDEYDMIECEG